MSEQQKVVLAYSGGLDTSCILKWLLEKGYKVICYMANLGQEEDFEEARNKALKIGASKVVIEDLNSEFVEKYIWPAVKYGLIYENRYLLGTSVARPCITKGLIKCAQENGAQFISHGATGKGNDQVRFELSAYYLWPQVKVLAPWRIPEFIQRFQGRTDLLEYAAKNGIPVSASPKAPWSMDANLMHVSYESGILEDPSTEPPQDLFLMTKNPELVSGSLKLSLEFARGLPQALLFEDGKKIEGPLAIFTELNTLGGQFGLGRIDIVENRFIGMKSRGVYEAPGGYILFKAHQDLEVFCMDKEVYRLKNYLCEKLSDYVYNGFWYSPEANFTRNCLDFAEEQVTGVVKIKLLPGAVFILGRKSAESTYNKDLVSMDKHADFSPEDATGFINIQALRLKEYRKMENQF